MRPEKTQPEDQPIEPDDPNVEKPDADPTEDPNTYPDPDNTMRTP